MQAWQAPPALAWLRVADEPLAGDSAQDAPAPLHSLPVALGQPDGQHTASLLARPRRARRYVAAPLRLLRDARPRHGQGPHKSPKRNWTCPAWLPAHVAVALELAEGEAGLQGLLLRRRLRGYSVRPAVETRLIVIDDGRVVDHRRIHIRAWRQDDERCGVKSIPRIRSWPH